MTRRAIWLAIGLLIAWNAVAVMPVSQAGNQRVGAVESAPAAPESPLERLPHWQPFSQGLPTYALAVTVAVQPTDPATIYVARMSRLACGAPATGGTRG